MPDSDREQGKESGGSSSGQGQGRQNLVKYGELVILGYNGQLPQGNYLLKWNSLFCKKAET